MEPLKRRWRNLSLRKTLVVYITAAAVLALALCAVTAGLCESTVQKVYAAYPSTVEKYYLTNERGERIGDGNYIGRDLMPLSPKDQRTVDVLRALPGIAAPLYSALCILAAAILFYRDKLRKPLAELRLASEKISCNDLDFTVTVHSRDELGQLCASFETMRAALARNFSEMWRQMEERKRLNAAFAHDLRTPLKALAASLYESGTILCERAEKRFSMQNRTTSPALLLDGDLISQVYGNLMANAARYAASGIELCLEETPEGLLLSVSDDGPGFDKSGLKKAAEPYFTGEKADHLDLGLYTSKILCEHHGGWLRLENTASGARVTVFFKSR